ncbi:MAG TPA: hypothetical protein VFA44_07585 [Gaiellaceae bacterium]|nr:hypothetical protein [Gaiellaceae bacterium]
MGLERLACLVAHHTGARAEAEERRLLARLDAFPEERSLLADALAYCDLATAPDGSPTTPEARLADVIARYGDAHPVGRAVERSREELLERVRPLRGVGAGGATAG